MIARIKYRVRSWLSRRALERACPELRTLRLAKAKARKRHGHTWKIEERQAEILNRAIGWRGGR